MDIYNREKRSEIMSKVRSKNTKPEMLVRRSLHALGYRYRVHVNNLPGKPDIVLSKHKSIIFTNGCFWHQHPGCKKASLPKTNQEFWRHKLKGNVDRDFITHKKLKLAGWRIITIWECEIENNLQGTISQVVKKLEKYF